MKNRITAISLIMICSLSNHLIDGASPTIKPEITIKNNSHYPVLITSVEIIDKIKPELFSLAESAEQAKQLNENKVTRIMPGKDFKYLLATKDENKSSIYGNQFNIHTMEKITRKNGPSPIHNFNLQTHDKVKLYEFVPGDMIDKEITPLKEKIEMIINQNGTISLK